MLALNKEIMVDTALFRSLSARITAAVIFMVLVIMMIYSQLPYQLPLNPNKAPIVKTIHQIIAIVSTCSLILFFFIPTKKMAVFATISMGALFLSYNATKAGHFENWMFFIPLFPFCLPDNNMYEQLKYQKWVTPLLFLIVFSQHGTNHFQSFSILLYILPYLPFERITKWVNNQLEPR